MTTLTVLLSTEKDILLLLIALLLGVLVFMALRTVLLWYWKVDVIIKELQELNANFKQVVKLQGGTPQEIAPAESWWKEKSEEEKINQWMKEKENQ